MAFSIVHLNAIGDDDFTFIIVGFVVARCDGGSSKGDFVIGEYTNAFGGVCGVSGYSATSEVYSITFVTETICYGSIYFTTIYGDGAVGKKTVAESDIFCRGVSFGTASCRYTDSTTINGNAVAGNDAYTVGSIFSFRTRSLGGDCTAIDDNTSLVSRQTIKLRRSNGYSTAFDSDISSYRLDTFGCIF